MPIEFDCPHCDKLLRTGDHLAGQKANCPHCGRPVNIPYPEAEELFEDDEEIEEPYDATTWPGDESGSRRARSTATVASRKESAPAHCLHCGEAVPPHARQCPRCREALPAGAHPVATAQPVPNGLDAADILRRSWKILTTQMGMCVGAVWLPQILTGMIAKGVDTLRDGLNVAMMAQPGAAAAGLMAVSGGLWLAMSLLSFYFISGQLLVMLKVVRGEPAELADLFRGGRFMFRLMLVSSVEVVIQGSVLLLIAIPAITVMMMFQHRPELVAITLLLTLAAAGIAITYFLLSSWPFGYVLVDRSPPGLGCMRQAVQITRGHRGAIFVLATVAGLVAASGLLLLCFGLVVTVPLAWVMFAVAYCDLTGQPTADV